MASVQLGEIFMKRDMELIREILLLIEADSFDGSIEGYDSEIVEKHMKLLIAEKLINRNSVGIGGKFATTTELTWAGHEFIENLRQKEIWNTIKTEFKEESVSTILGVAKQMAENFAKKKLDKLLGEVS